MNKFAALVWLTAIAIAALGLYRVKYEVQHLEKRLGLEYQSILKQQEALHILKAEWSYLNQPARIADLASRHLNLQPLSADKVVQLDYLPLRSAGQPAHEPVVSKAAPAAAPGSPP